MTREEAIYEANENHNACYLDEFIDKIYDDFESRTCENCKHYDMNSAVGYCDTYDISMVTKELKLIPMYKNFGCNKFERKES